MMNRISQLGPAIMMGKDNLIHTSGHAYRDEQEELLRLVMPHNFLPVHGEYVFLCAHAQLGRDVGIKHTHVIKNGQILGINEQRSSYEDSIGSLVMSDTVDLQLYYNDGVKGTGSAFDMAMSERMTLAVEGIIICAVEIVRVSNIESIRQRHLQGVIRITTRAMWTCKGLLLQEIYKVAQCSLESLPTNANISTVEKEIGIAIKKAAKDLTGRRPEVIVVAHDRDQHLSQIA